MVNFTTSMVTPFLSSYPFKYYNTSSSDKRGSFLDGKLHPRYLGSEFQALYTTRAPVFCQDIKDCSESQRAFARWNIMETPNGAG
jgi:hypothetical protein